MRIFSRVPFSALAVCTALTLFACSGDSGDDGIAGTDGKDGISGVDGTNGINGTNGKDGKDGKDGRDFDSRAARAGHAEGLSADCPCVAREIFAACGGDYRLQRQDDHEGSDGFGAGREFSRAPHGGEFQQ